MGDDAVLALGSAVIIALTGNTHIPSPQPGLVQLQAAYDAFNLSNGKAKYGSRNDRAQKNTDKAALITLLREECDYINLLAQGDIVILSTCGFPLSKDRQPKVLGTPEAKVEQAGSGKLVLSTPAVTGAVSYKHQYTSDANAAAWTEISTSRATYTIEGLTPGTVYHLKIVAIGTKDQVTVSDVVTKMAA